MLACKEILQFGPEIDVEVVLALLIRLGSTLGVLRLRPMSFQHGTINYLTMRSHLSIMWSIANSKKPQ